VGFWQSDFTCFLRWEQHVEFANKLFLVRIGEFLKICQRFGTLGVGRVCRVCDFCFKITDYLSAYWLPVLNPNC